MQVTVRGDEALLTVLAPGPDRTGWSTVWQRLSGASSSPDDGASPGQPDGRHLLERDGAARAVLAALVAHRCFAHTTGIETDRSRQVHRLDLETLATTEHAVPPGAPPESLRLRSAEQFRAAMTARQDLIGPDEAEFSGEAARCLDERTGVLLSLGGRHFEQIPLWVEEARVAQAGGLLATASEPRTVYGAGLEFLDARHLAARKGLELYAASMLDPRQLLSVDGHRLDSGCSDPLGQGWLWGWSLDGTGERLVPASLVFGSGRQPDLIPTGVTSGRMWAEAVARGLLSWCERHAEARTAVRPVTTPAPEPGSAPWDRISRRLLGILRLQGGEVRVHDLSAEAGVPQYAVALDGGPVVHAAELTPSRALRKALARAVVARQSRVNGQPEYAQAAVSTDDAGGSAGRAGDREGAGNAAQEPVETSDSYEVQKVARLAEVVRSVIGPPVVVPLDHDPSVAAAVPHALRVVVMPATASGKDERE